MLGTNSNAETTQTIREQPGTLPFEKNLKKKKKGNSIYNIVLRKAFVYSLHFKNRKTELTSVQGRGV